MQKWFGTLLLFISLLLVLASCGKAPDAIPASGTFGNVYTVTLKTTCLRCHIPTGAATVNNGVKLDFTSQTTAYTTLLANNVTGQTSQGICPNVKIVTASDPTKSYLAAVLFTKYYSTNFAGQSGCTPYNVHLTDQSLSADEQTSFVAWIQGGALNN